MVAHIERKKNKFILDLHENYGEIPEKCERSQVIAGIMLKYIIDDIKQSLDILKQFSLIQYNITKLRNDFYNVLKSLTVDISSK